MFLWIYWAFLEFLFAFSPFFFLKTVRSSFFFFLPGQVTDRQATHGPHAVILTSSGSPAGRLKPRWDAYWWVAAGQGPFVWGRRRTWNELRLPDWNIYTWISPQMSWRPTACNKSGDLTPGQVLLRFSRWLRLFFGGFLSETWPDWGHTAWFLQTCVTMVAEEVNALFCS